jgi:hypothetical protein
VPFHLAFWLVNRDIAFALVNFNYVNYFSNNSVSFASAAFSGLTDMRTQFYNLRVIARKKPDP